MPYLEGLITDQHLIERDRLGRTLTFMARIVADGWSAESKAIAIDRETAVLVDGHTGRATIVANTDHSTPYAYFIRGDVTLQGQLSLGRQKKASVSVDPVTGDLRDARWWGLSALAAYKFNPRLEGIVRVDYLNNKKNGGGLLAYTYADDRNGIGPDINGDPDKGANRTALSLGLSYAFNLETTLKAEYRIDRANLPVFLDVKSGGYRKSNQIFGTSVVVAF